jgi:glycosyltransferase involved in cell wall biosynthesis
MKIAIDAHMLGHHETGNETHIRELILALSELATQDEFYILVEDSRNAPRLGPNWQTLTLPSPSPLRRLLYDLPRLARQYRFDVLHVTYNAPFFSPCPVVATVHDVSYARYPEYFSLRDRLVLSTLVPRSVRAARRVFTGTEFARRELGEVYPLSLNKTALTPYAAGKSFYRDDGPGRLESVRMKFGTSPDFILAVGNLQPRKNLVRLIQAYARVVRDHNFPHKLVLVGQQQWKASDVWRAVEEQGLHEGVVLTGFVSDDELRLLYNAATVFVYPSLYEGFGLPVLEAMACGAPVIASNTSSLPEIAGDAARLVDPRDTDELAWALVEVLSDSNLRAAMTQRGLANAKRYSWQDTARIVLDAYHAVL